MAEDFSSLGQIIFGCIALASAIFGISQFLGKQWVETKFAEFSTKAARDHKAAIARLKIEIEGLRAARKLQELDFAALPGTWERLEKAYSAAKSIIRFGEYKIDVERLTSSELGEMTSTMEWFQAEINLVKSLDGHVRQDEFDNIRFRYQLARVKEACLELEAYVATNTIFYPAEMLKELKYFAVTLQQAVAAKEKAGIRGAAADDLVTALSDEKFASRISATAASIRKKLESHETPAKT